MAKQPDRLYSDGSIFESTPSAGDPDCIRRIQRRGIVYVVKDQLPEHELFDQMSEDLYVESIQLSLLANRRARIFKFFQVIGTIYLIICGTVIGVLTLEGYSGSVTLYIAAILGFSITAIQTLLSTFAFEKRSVLLKYISNKLRKVSREIKMVQSADVKYKKKMSKLEDLYSEVDDLDISMFDSNITSGSISQGTNISQYKSANPNLLVFRKGETIQEPQVMVHRKWSVGKIFSKFKKESPSLPVKMRDSDIERKLEEEIDGSD